MSRPHYAKPQRQGFYKKTVTLTDAQIKALPTTPVDIVGAPGAGKILIFNNAYLRLVWNDDYTNIDATANIALGSALSNWVSLITENVLGSVSSLLANGENSNGFLLKTQGVDGTNIWGITGHNDDAVVNNPIQILSSNGAAGDFTGGHAANTLIIVVYYDILTL